MAHSLSIDQPGESVKSQNRLFRVLLAVIVAAPLVIVPGVFFYFDVTPKVAVVLLGTAAALLFRQPCWAPRGREVRFLLSLLCAQAASLLIATVFSDDRGLSVTGTNWRRFGLETQYALLVFTWLLVSALVISPIRRSLSVLRAVAASGSLAAVYAIAQYFGWDPLLPTQAYHIGAGVWSIVRPPGTMGHATYFATYMLHGVFAGAALIMVERSRRLKLIAAAACALGSAAIVLSGTRAAVLGLFAGGMLLLLWFRPWIRFGAIMASLTVATLLILFYVSPAGEKLRSRVRWSSEDPLGGGRLLMWRDTLRLAGSCWATGTGPEMFSSHFPRFQSAELSKAYPDFYHESPHNIFLDALAAQGVSGLLVLILMTGLGFSAAWHARNTEPRISGALAATMVASLTSQQFSVFILTTALLFYLTVAMSVSLASLPPPSISDPAAGWRSWLQRAAQLVVAVVFAVFAFRLLAADSALAAVRSHLDRGDLAAAVKEHEQVLRWQPPGMNSELWYSRSLVLLAQKSPNILTRLQASQHGFEAAKRAVDSPEECQNAHHNLAAFYASRNDPAGTEQSLRNAIACSPNSYKPHWLLAHVLRAVGRLKEAEAQAALAVELNGGRHPEVTKTLREIRASME